MCVQRILFFAAETKIAFSFRSEPRPFAPISARGHSALEKGASAHSRSLYTYMVEEKKQEQTDDDESRFFPKRWADSRAPQ